MEGDIEGQVAVCLLYCVVVCLVKTLLGIMVAEEGVVEVRYIGVYD